MPRFVLVLLTAIMLAGAVTVFAAEPPRVDFATWKAEDLDEKGWSAPRQDGEVAFRIMEGGGKRRFYVKAWWNEGELHPPEGSAWILEPRYRDTFKTPARFFANSGMSGWFNDSEIHRFGGSGDGAWKTASIPVTDEYLCRCHRPIKPWLHRPADTFFAIQCGEDVPVASMTARPLRDGDRERYFEEIRRFNALEQAADHAKTPYPASQGKVNALPNGPIAYPWTRADSLLADFKPTEQLAAEPLKVRMCLNEMQPAAFGVFANGVDLKQVNYRLSPLTGEAGTLDAEITCRTAEYTLLKRGQVFWLPQRLWPAYAVDIPEGRSHYFVANLQTFRNRTKPGLYKGTLTITHAQGAATLPLEVEVLPVDLLTMDEAGLQFGGCTTGLVSMSDVRFQVAYNQTAINLWYSAVFPFNLGVKDGGELELDYTYMDAWMTRARKHGMRQVVYFLGGGPTTFPATITLGAELAGMGPETKGGNENWKRKVEWFTKQGLPAHRDKLLPETRTLYMQWVRQFMAHARENAWPEMILTPFDEPATWRSKRKTTRTGSIGSGPWIRSYFKDCCAAIHEADPKARVYASIHDLRKDYGICFLPDVDVFCTNAIMQDEAAPGKVRAASKDAVAAGGQPKEWWQYSFVGYSKPEYIRYTLGYFFGHYDARGGLVWAYNWEDGWNSMKSGWRYAWQTPLGTIPGNFFEGVREGLDDRRILETCKLRLKNDPEAMAELDQLLVEFRKARGASGTSHVNDFWTGISDPALLEQWRHKLLDRLAKAAATR